MSTYSAPIDDMQFVVKDLIGLEAISQLPGGEEVTPDLVDAVIEEAGKFAAGVLDPLNQPGDQHGAVLNEHVVTTAPGFSEAYEQFCEAGWGALSNDPQWGGQGLPHIIASLTSEMWNAACMSHSTAAASSTSAYKVQFLHSPFLVWLCPWIITLLNFVSRNLASLQFSRAQAECENELRFLWMMTQSISQIIPSLYLGL